MTTGKDERGIGDERHVFDRSNVERARETESSREHAASPRSKPPGSEERHGFFCGSKPLKRRYKAGSVL
jgi:hypothetical protein